MLCTAGLPIAPGPYSLSQKNGRQLCSLLLEQRAVGPKGLVGQWRGWRSPRKRVWSRISQESPQQEPPGTGSTEEHCPHSGRKMKYVLLGGIHHLCDASLNADRQWWQTLPCSPLWQSKQQRAGEDGHCLHTLLLT